MSLGILANLSKLKQLEYLNLEGCLAEIQGLKGLTSIGTLHLRGCNSSLLACIFTESFFQIYSEFEHQIVICIRSEEFPEWIDQSEYETTMSLDLQPNLSNNYLGMILCFNRQLDHECFEIDYTVKTFASNFFTERNTVDCI